MEAFKFFRKARSCLIFCLLFFSSVSYAAYTAVNGVAARSQSLQAFTAVADDPSTIYYNPAGITQVKGTQIDGTVNYIAPDQKYTNSDNDIDSKSTRASLANSLFVTYQYTPRLYFGLGLYSPFARVSWYSTNAATSNLNNRATLLRLDLVPTVAYQILPNLSLGVGVVASYVYTDSDILGLAEKASGQGFTGQAGLLWRWRNLKIGVGYRGREGASLRGKGTSSGETDAFTMYFKFPSTLSVGLACQATDNWLFSFAFDEEFWSYVNKASRHYSIQNLNNIGTNTIDGRDASNLHFGLMYTFRKHNEFRVGYSYLWAAIPGKWVLPAKPDYNVNMFSAGFSRYVKNFRFDLAFEYGFSPTRKSNSENFPGGYKLMKVLNYMAGISYHFGSPHEDFVPTRT